MVPKASGSSSSASLSQAPPPVPSSSLPSMPSVPPYYSLSELNLFLWNSPHSFSSELIRTCPFKIKPTWASLVAQWLRVCLPMQGTRVRALVWEDPTCRGATRPVGHSCWACASGACALQQERPWQWEARAPRWRVVPARCKSKKPSHRNEDPMQPKIK